MTDEKKSDAVDEEKSSESTQDDADSLDTILAQYDEESKASEPVKPESKEPLDDVKGAVEEIRQWKQEQQAERTQADLAKAASAIRGEISADVFDDDEVIAWLDAQAKKEPNLVKAFSNRRTNPKGWQKATEVLGARFQKKFSGQFDQRATNDREAVSAAVRGASTKTQDSDGPSLAEYRNWPESKKEQYAREVSRQYAKG